MDQVTLLSVALEGLTDAVRVVEEPLVTLDEPEMEMEVTGVVLATAMIVSVYVPLSKTPLTPSANASIPTEIVPALEIVPLTCPR